MKHLWGISWEKDQVSASHAMDKPMGEREGSAQLQFHSPTKPAGINL